jgi:hypothetical protein
MATQPEIAPPDTIQPQSTSEVPAPNFPSEAPDTNPPEIIPQQPDFDQPDISPAEAPELPN